MDKGLHERLKFVVVHHALLSDVGRDRQMRYNAPMMLHHSHVRLLLESAGTTGDLDTQATALLALLDADYVHHELTDRGRTIHQLGDAWETVARKLCGS